MLSWALLFLVLGLVAAVFGFTGIAAASAGIAKIIFFVFLVLLVISLVAHAVRGRRPPIYHPAGQDRPNEHGRGSAPRPCLFCRLPWGAAGTDRGQADHVPPRSVPSASPGPAPLDLRVLAVRPSFVPDLDFGLRGQCPPRLARRQLGPVGAVAPTVFAAVVRTGKYELDDQRHHAAFEVGRLWGRAGGGVDGSLSASSKSRNFARARDTRDFTVPISVPSTAAASP